MAEFPEPVIIKTNLGNTATLYCADCVQGMSGMADKAFELAIVDPDFGLGDKLTCGGTWAQKRKRGDADWGGKPSEKYWGGLFRVSVNQVVWGGNYFQLPPSRCFLIWDKIAIMATLADCEMAWTSFDRNAKIFRHVRDTSETRIHICQKPVILYKWILKTYANPGDKILDTNMGSGSSVIACLGQGHDVTAFEIDPEYFSAAVKRIRTEAAQNRLF